MPIAAVGRRQEGGTTQREASAIATAPAELPLGKAFATGYHSNGSPGFGR
jgi:hypothetical protein